MTTTVAVTRLPFRSRLLRFAAVGGAGFAVDLAVFNLLRDTVWSPDHAAHGALVAKTVSTLAAIGVNWIGNRQWAFRDARRGGLAGEGLRFLAASGVGMLVGLGCLWWSHDVLGLTTAIDDNLSANVVGLLLGTAVRFVLYRAWVFRGAAHRPRRSDARPRR